MLRPWYPDRVNYPWIMFFNSTVDVLSLLVGVYKGLIKCVKTQVRHVYAPLLLEQNSCDFFAG